MQPQADKFKIVKATESDEDLIRGLLDGASWQHRHLDWSPPLALLGQQPFLMALDEGVPIGLLACPPDPPGVAWIRLLAVASGYDVDKIWRPMWQQAATTLQAQGVKQAAALCIPPWLPAILRPSDFATVDSVRFLEWSADTIPAEPTESLPVEPLLATNLTAVTRVDNRAFAPIWRHSLEALQKALKHASYATVTRQAGEVAGYQISTLSQHGGHLARLAIDPKFQGRGLASYLVVDLLRHFKQRGVNRVTVNTQGSNQRSQALYQRLGFRSLDQEFPVLCRNL